MIQRHKQTRSEAGSLSCFGPAALGSSAVLPRTIADAGKKADSRGRGCCALVGLRCATFPGAADALALRQLRPHSILEPAGRSPPPGRLRVSGSRAFKSRCRVPRQPGFDRESQAREEVWERSLMLILAHDYEELLPPG